MQTFDFENVYRRMFVHIFDPILDRFQYPKADTHAGNILNGQDFFVGHGKIPFTIDFIYSIIQM